MTTWADDLAYDPEDYWDDDPYDDREPDEPDCCSFGTCSWCQPPPGGRAYRKLARRWRMQRQRQRKVERHANDRFWQARNRPAFDDEAPF